MSTLDEGIILMVYCIIMPYAFIVCVMWAVRKFRQTSQLIRIGVSTEGQIVGHRASILTRAGSYFVSYRFSVDGQVVSLEQEVSYKRYRLLEIGTPVEITY